MYIFNTELMILADPAGEQTLKDFHELTRKTVLAQQDLMKKIQYFNSIPES